MFRTTPRMLLIVAGVALIAVLGFVAGKAMANGATGNVNPSYSAIQSDTSTPAGIVPANGSLAPTNTADNSANASAADTSDPTDASGNDTGDAESDVTGTVTQINFAQSRLSLSTSQGTLNIVANAQTEFGDGIASFADIQTGMVLSVAGQPQANGEIIADSIDNANPPPDSAGD